MTLYGSYHARNGTTWAQGITLRRLMLDTLKERGPQTMAQLCQATGSTRQALAKHVVRLIVAGAVAWDYDAKPLRLKITVDSDKPNS